MFIVENRRRVTNLPILVLFLLLLRYCKSTGFSLIESCSGYLYFVPVFIQYVHLFSPYIYSLTISPSPYAMDNGDWWIATEDTKIPTSTQVEMNEM